MNLVGKMLIISLAIVLLFDQAALLVRAKEKCQDLKTLSYEFHGTKTLYEDARRQLSKMDDDDLPKSFDDDSMAKEDKELREDSCNPIAFYFVGRHSARFPDGVDIDQYNKDLYNLIEKIKSNTTCSKKGHQEVLDWRTKMQYKHDNLITDLGAREQRDIARRFKKVFPDFFDTNKATVQIGVTKKLRTAQTGAQFLHEVDGLKLNDCDQVSLPTNDLNRPDYNLDKVLEAACYKQMIDNHYKPFLEFHKVCKSIRGESKIKDPMIDRVKSPEIRMRIANRIAERLGFEAASGVNSTSPITPQVLDSIYDMCKFENAMDGHSIWCDLFEKKDVQALEYIEDVNTYFKNAYGPNANPRQSCPLISHLLEEFSNATKMSPKDKKRAYFFFSHAGPMKSILATFGMFRDDDSFSESRIRDFERELKVPKKRHWRASLITPFSANIAFVLYRCERSNKPVKHKIMAMVTEQPVTLGGCKDTDCNSEKFFSAYDDMRTCDMQRICSPKSR